MFLYRLYLLFGGTIRSREMNLEYRETGKVDTGFAEYFRAKIKPHFARFEELRLQKLTKIVKAQRLGLLVSNAVILTIILISILKSALDVEQFFTICAITVLIINGSMTVFSVLYFSLGNYSDSVYRAVVKKYFFTTIFNFFEGFEYFPLGIKVGEDQKSKNIQGIFRNIWGKNNIRSSEDGVVGKYKDVEIRLEEFCLEKFSWLKFFMNFFSRNSNSTNYRVFFRGPIIFFSLNKNFRGKTIIKKDLGKVGNFIVSSKDYLLKVQKVELEDPEFEKIFEIYSSDQIEARYLLTTSFMQRILDLSRMMGGSKIEALFYKNNLILAIACDYDLFEPRSVFSEIDLVKESQMIVNEMSAIFDIVDILKLNEKTGL